MIKRKTARWERIQRAIEILYEIVPKFSQLIPGVKNQEEKRLSVFSFLSSDLGVAIVSIQINCFHGHKVNGCKTFRLTR